ncbi:hypothetical protein ACSHT0_00160 [Tepidicaulis sp. LMO-SS28]|uniref:hypothetical protein n=1 Tax=Tepidicaulis sp. LMO-SS28 TaxID=3447455 RepID=UPI003EE07477
MGRRKGERRQKQAAENSPEKDGLFSESHVPFLALHLFLLRAGFFLTFLKREACQRAGLRGFLQDVDIKGFYFVLVEARGGVSAAGRQDLAVQAAKFSARHLTLTPC